jgi:spermidine/putrescine transport system permease protein/putrescine transport system permease protein
LTLFTWLYLTWWLVPMLLLIRASLSDSFDIVQPTGFSLRGFRSVFRDDVLLAALEHSVRLAVATVAIALPLGTALALGLQHMVGRLARWMRGLTLFALAMPQAFLSVGIFLVIVYLTPDLRFGGTTQLLAHVTVAIPFVTVIVMLRLYAIGPEHEETAMDLGATPTSAFRRVVLPQLGPALMAAAAVAFVLSFDNIIMSDNLCISNDCRTVPLFLFRGRGEVAADPGVAALGVVGMILTAALAALAFPVLIRLTGRYRRA